ncbi:hypothetical protein CRUP_017239 [Coryphaenoides rupestris]|nr:hypothetical protein CRUP_017239 [Coryphaenoides rupestris]
MADEPLNFLDPTVSQRVLATNPKMKKKSKESHGFKVTSDGRLIIKDDDDEEDDVKKDAEDEMKDILEEAGVRTKKTQKRKFDDDLDEDMETTDVDPYAYIPLRKAQLNRRKKKIQMGSHQSLGGGRDGGGPGGPGGRRPGGGPGAACITGGGALEGGVVRGPLLGGLARGTEDETRGRCSGAWG